MSKPSKGLIDLSRANAPTPPVPEAEPQAPREGAAPIPEATEPKPLRVRTAKADPTPPDPAPVVVALAANEPVSTLGARIPASLHKRIKLFCTEREVEMQRFVQDALTAHLAALQSGERQ